MTKKQFQWPVPPNHRVMCDGKEVENLTKFNIRDRFCLHGTVAGDLDLHNWKLDGSFDTFPHKYDLYLLEIEPAFKPCGEGDNICNCKSSEECGYRGIAEFQAGEIEKGNMVSIGEKTPPKEQEGEKPHLCKYCGAWTDQSDEECYANPEKYPLPTPPEKRAFVNVYRHGFTRFLSVLEYPTKEEALRDIDRECTYLETIQIIRRERE